MKSFILVCIIFFSFTITAQETINTMFYNLLEFPEASSSDRPEILKDILNEFQPAIFMVCELQSDKGANLIMDITLNSQTNTYSRVLFASNQSSNSDLQQLIQQNELKNTDSNSIDVSFLQAGLFYIKTNIPNAPVLKFIKN